MTPKEVILNSFKNLLENPNADQSSIEKWFSPQYCQNVDGKEIDYDGFKAHYIALREATKSIKVDIVDIVSEGGRVFTNHIVNIIKKNGEQAQLKVLALFKVENNKIMSCDELTYLLKGIDSDADLGSRK